ncbi:uncharacterized protein LOC101356251 [Trichechus manatus latirostris]|uniref:Uncharacterized protein LOC101356251 n=1 Tax=Trichechus manatus latirostris TaxID=127582 RepID=A0A2Y9RTH2_TRIMA|nr:uncharacterized protein LOC101356251 [Trichechus manatus latirostris]
MMFGIRGNKDSCGPIANTRRNHGSPRCRVRALWVPARKPSAAHRASPKPEAEVSFLAWQPRSCHSCSAVRSVWPRRRSARSASGCLAAPVPGLRALCPLPAHPWSPRASGLPVAGEPPPLGRFLRPRRRGRSCFLEAAEVGPVSRSQVWCREKESSPGSRGPRVPILHIHKSQGRISTALAGVWTKHYSSASKLPSALLPLPSLFLTWLHGLRDDIPLDFQKLEKEMAVKSREAGKVESVSRQFSDGLQSCPLDD